MKKFSVAVLSAIFVCVFAAGLSGCKQNKIDGKYYLTDAGAQNGGFMYELLRQNEQGVYENINGGLIVPENFWVEINGEKMTVHGSVSPSVAGSVIKFNVDEDYVSEFTFTLKEKETNRNWYEIYADGENTLYSVTKSGTDVFLKFGHSDDLSNYWYTVSYAKK